MTFTFSVVFKSFVVNKFDQIVINQSNFRTQHKFGKQDKTIKLNNTGLSKQLFQFRPPCQRNTSRGQKASQSWSIPSSNHFFARLASRSFSHMFLPSSDSTSSSPIMYLSTWPRMSAFKRPKPRCDERNRASKSFMIDDILRREEPTNHREKLRELRKSKSFWRENPSAVLACVIHRQNLFTHFKLKKQ